MMHERLEDNRFSSKVAALYPFVDVNKTPLPLCWNNEDKQPNIGLSHSNLRVTYKGLGKNHKDAAAVRTAYPIPPRCGIYYFEIRVISKGRDGYMGVGLCQKDVSLQRLPGWDRNSFGYHGDDGNFFCSSGSGTPYGPTFSTGDVVGCGLDFVNNSCFFTKNGQNLGVAFTDLPNDLFPTAGLQTPGEVIEANFGQQPFIYDIHRDISETKVQVQNKTNKYQVPVEKEIWFNRLVLSYLVQKGYSQTAEIFSQQSKIRFDEEIDSIRKRMDIKKLVISGQIMDACSIVNQIYPGLLERNLHVLFELKLRNFIELLCSSRLLQIRCSSGTPSLSSSGSSPGAAGTSPQYSQNSSEMSSEPRCLCYPSSQSPQRIPEHSFERDDDQEWQINDACAQEDSSDSSFSSNYHLNGVNTGGTSVDRCEDGESALEPQGQGDCTMVSSGRQLEQYSNGALICENATVPSYSNRQPFESSPTPPPLYYQNNVPTTVIRSSFENQGNQNGSGAVPGGTSANCEKHAFVNHQTRCQMSELIECGQELSRLSKQLSPTTTNEGLINKMDNAFSLMAYNDPFASPHAALLDFTERESVAENLNSAILVYLGYSNRSPIEKLIQHCKRMRKELGSSSAAGTASFLSVEDFVNLK